MAYPPVRASVLSPNGLYGSMGTAGMVLALRLRQRWPSILLNETHPKVLAFALRGERHRDDDPSAAIKWFAQHSALNRTRIATGHELDAALSAWATREGLLHGWTNLVTDDPSLLSPAGTTTYFWPQLPTEPMGANLKSGPATERRETRATTSIGYLNRNQQEVIRATSLPGTDHGQRIYVLRCSVCGHEYGDNGSGIFQRRCPKHDVGAPGQAY